MEGLSAPRRTRWAMRPPGPPEQLQQRPKRGAVERDEAAIDRWEWEEWPWIKPRYTTWGPSRRPR